jgi:uncharacterized cupin superfamily protein
VLLLDPHRATAQRIQSKPQGGDDYGMSPANIYNVNFEYEADDPPAYASAEGLIDGKSVGAAAGAQAVSVRVYEMPPGKQLCPYHYEYCEEWLLVISGDLELRTPSGISSITKGDLVCFPAGPDGAHKVTTTGAEAAHIMMWSPKANPEVAVYPDSDKIGVFTDNPKDHFRFLRSDADVPYFDGEV